MDTRQSTVHFGSSGNAPMQPSGGPDTKKILTLTAFALTIAILLCFCAVIITEIVYKVSGGSDGGEIADVGYKNLSLSSDEVNKGELLIINNSYPLKDKSNADELENVYNYNLSNPAEYYYLKPSEISLLPVTIEAFNKMTDAFVDKFLRREGETVDADALAFDHGRILRSALAMLIPCDFPEAVVK